MATDRRILVTGAGGQLGRAIERLVPDAVLLDRAALDVTDDEGTRRKIAEHQPDVVIHGAAYTKVDAAEDDPDGAAVLNIGGTRSVAAAVADVGATMVYPSTDYVFDGMKARYSEGDETGPLSVYGRTKLEGELIVQNLPRHLIVRTSWVFGDGQNFLRSILAAAASRSELTVVDDQRGLPTYALDLVDGILKLLERNVNGLFHLSGGGEPCTWADLAEEALRVAGSSTMVRRVSTKEYLASREGSMAPRPANSVLDTTKAASLSVTLRPWPEAVSDYVREIK